MVKPVNLSNEAYEVLSRMKSEGDSFSDVVLRLAEKKKFNLERFKGILSDGEAKKMKAFVRDERRRFRIRMVKF